MKLNVQTLPNGVIELSHEGREEKLLCNRILAEMMAAFVFKAEPGEVVYLSVGNEPKTQLICHANGSVSIERDILMVLGQSAFLHTCPRTLRQWLFEVLHEVSCHSQLTPQMRATRLKHRVENYATVST